ncbi:MAG: DUF547 domain-containing protein [Sedimentisphaerales bacterium]
MKLRKHGFCDFKYILFVVSTILLSSLFFIAGCQPIEQQPTKAVEVQTQKTGSVEIEPVKNQQPKIEPPTVSPLIPEPNQIEPEITEPNIIEPNVVIIQEAEPSAIGPNKVERAAEVSFYDRCADVFENFIDENGMVDYQELKSEKTKLRELLDEFDEFDPKVYNSWPEEERIAFWLNAYNIKLLDIIIDNYPIESYRILRVFWPADSIRHIRPRSRIGTAKWEEYKFIVMDEEFNLLEIERRFFRKEFDEPRVFLAMSQASLSGPPLCNEPYYGHRLNEQLDEQVKQFLSNQRVLKIDREEKKVYLSALFEPGWYGREFINKYGTNEQFTEHPPAVKAVLNFISKYVSAQDALFLSTKTYSIKFIGYDWRLNDKQ